MTRDENLVAVIVRPRRVLYGRGGAVHYPGEVLNVTEDDYAPLSARRVVSLASPENVAAIRDAIAKALPTPGYVRAEHDDTTADPADPRDVARRSTAAKPKARRSPRRPASSA